MTIFISGICGFVGRTLALALLETEPQVALIGCDNLIRAGSETSRATLRRRGVKVIHADIRMASDLDAIPPVDWIIDAAANPSVLAGVGEGMASRRLVEHNLFGTVNLLELAKRWRAGFVILSTSRVYSIPSLAGLQVEEHNGAYNLAGETSLPAGISQQGIAETFSTAAPVSLYGSTKLASECMALEYGEAFRFPVWINRCGVLAGAGQFGRADQGIFAFWLNAYVRKRPLNYVGFEGKGWQVRDVLHPRDLVRLLLRQMKATDESKPRIANIGGGIKNSISLAQLSDWCGERWGVREIGSQPKPRPFDLPWVVMDSALAKEIWRWEAETPLVSVLDEIAAHAEAHPEWLELSDA